MGKYHEHELLPCISRKTPRSVFKREKLVLVFGNFPKLTIILSNKIYTGFSLTRFIELRYLGLQDTQQMNYYSCRTNLPPKSLRGEVYSVFLGSLTDRK